jgi:hypothetical protein
MSRLVLLLGFNVEAPIQIKLMAVRGLLLAKSTEVKRRVRRIGSENQPSDKTPRKEENHGQEYEEGRPTSELRITDRPAANLPHYQDYECDYSCWNQVC